MTTAQMTQVTKLGKTVESMPRPELIMRQAQGALNLYHDAGKVRENIDAGLARRGYGPLEADEWRGVCRVVNCRAGRRRVLEKAGGEWVDRPGVRGGVGIVQYVDAALAGWGLTALTPDEQQRVTDWQRQADDAGLKVQAPDVW